MLCAYNYPYLEQFLVYLDKPHETRKQRQTAILHKALVTIFCIAIFILWFYFILFQEREIYKRIHPFTAWIPIIIYIWMRNMFPYLRSTYLNLFAWLGKITLETYLSQIHIYMIGDAQKILTYIPKYPLLNFMVSTVIYIAVSYVLFHHTLFFNSFIFPKNMRVVCKNLIIGFLVVGLCYLVSFLLTLASVWWWLNFFLTWNYKKSNNKNYLNGWLLGLVVISLMWPWWMYPGNNLLQSCYVRADFVRVFKKSWYTARLYGAARTKSLNFECFHTRHAALTRSRHGAVRAVS